MLWDKYLKFLDRRHANFPDTVRESWVGPTSAAYGGETYEVITNLPSHGEERTA